MINHPTGVLVTRPAHQNDNLCAQLETIGCRPLPLPTLIIAPLSASALNQFATLLARRPAPDWLIFVSANAVEQSWPLISAKTRLATQSQFAAVGPATAAALVKRGVTVSTIPRFQYDSDGLLALPEFTAPLASRIVIIRGQGGRERLATQLTQRGAQVDYGECYRRALPADGAIQLTQWLQEGAIDLVIVTSRAALRNLFELATLADHETLKKLTYVLLSPTIEKTATTLGITGRLLVAKQASDAGICDAIEASIPVEQRQFRM